MNTWLTFVFHAFKTEIGRRACTFPLWQKAKFNTILEAVSLSTVERHTPAPVSCMGKFHTFPLHWSSCKCSQEGSLILRCLSNTGFDSNKIKKQPLKLFAHAWVPHEKHALAPVNQKQLLRLALFIFTGSVKCLTYFQLLKISVIFSSYGGITTAESWNAQNNN